MTGIVLIAIACYGLLALTVGPTLRRKQQREIDNALRSYGEYRKLRGVQFPGMIGKWGKP